MSAFEQKTVADALPGIGFEIQALQQGVVNVTVRDDETAAVLGRRPLPCGDHGPTANAALFEMVGGRYRLGSARVDLGSALLANKTQRLARVLQQAVRGRDTRHWRRLVPGA
jgi:hypothetical protein